MNAEEQIRKLGEFLDENYKAELVANVRKGESFLVVDFSLLTRFDPEVAEALLEQPEDIVKAAEVAVEGFDIDTKNFRIRFTNLPESQKIKIKDIRSKHLGKLLVVSGIVRQKSDVRPQVTSAKFECPSCGNIINILQLDSNFREPTRCGCGRKGKFRLVEKDLIDAQGLVLEEDPEFLEGGEQPKRINVILKEDLVSPLSERKTNPGSKVTVVGQVKEVPIISRMGNKSTRYDLIIEANCIEGVEETFYDIKITEEEIRQIKEISEDVRVYERLIGSIAPSIYGYDRVKEALILQLMGGSQKIRTDGIISRGDIHVLLVGDPGAGKSQLLKRINLVAPKGRYVSGKGVSGAGLCVAPGSLIITNPKGMYNIETVVEENLKDNKKRFCDGIWQARKVRNGYKVLTVDKGFKIKPRKVSQFWKLNAPEEMVSVTTQSGRQVILTKNTKMYTLDNGAVVWKKSEDFKTGDYLATLRNFKIKNGKKILVIGLISSNPIVYGVKNTVREMAEKIAGRYGTKRKAAKKLGINEDNIYYHWVKEGARGNIKLNQLKILAKESNTRFEEVAKSIKAISIWRGKKIGIPLYLNEELAYFAGLIAGDGNLSKSGNSIGIVFSNNSEQLLKRYEVLARQLFGAKCSFYPKSSERSACMKFNSKLVFEILEKLGIPKSPKSNKIDMSNILLNANGSMVRAFLKGVFDCDGGVAKRRTKGSSHVELTTTSEIFAKKIQLVLSIWGINSGLRKREAQPNERVKSKHVKYIIEIRSKENLERFRKEIGFELTEKKGKLDEIINRIKRKDTNVDVIPNVSKIIKDLKIRLGLISREMVGYKTSSYASTRFMPSRTRIKKILANIKRSKKFKKIKEVEILENLANSNITWEKVKGVNIIKNHGYDYVYDLTVEGSHNFCVNGILVHNTAAVVRDEFLKGWSLEAGALVLASNGICCIDELDKMGHEDRAAMHEALEQQTISISKANIQATLLARTTVLAAANPKLGRFDSYALLASQIDLPPTLINRFDLIFPIKDIPNKKEDEKMASHILRLHQKPEIEEPEIPTKLLKKYIAYARQNIRPVLTDGALKEIQDYYVTMRSKAISEDMVVRAIPITPRQLEASVRLAEASAKVRLSDKVTRKDARRAIDIINYCLREVGLDKETGEIDIDRISTGIPATERSKIVVVRDIIAELEKRMGKIIPIDDVRREASSKGLDDAQLDEAIEKLKRSGDLYEPRRGFLSRI